MAVRSGFWNSVGTDVRTYYNHDFSHLISLMIKDGVHQNYGECLTVVQGTGMQAIVRTGEAWFNETWVRCDSDLQIAVDAAPIVAGFSRIDAIAIKIDATQSVRNGTIEYIAGTATAETPSAPELVDTDEIHWHLLATILVRTGDEEVLGSRITNYVGTDTTPFISGILDTISAEVLLNQWQSEWTEWSDEKKREFTLWFNNLHYILDGDVAGHLQNEIEDLYRSIGFTGTMAEVEAAIQAGTITVGMVVTITDDNDADDFTALQVSYDGTESGSEATSVQGAIDENKAAIARINTDLSATNNITLNTEEIVGTYNGRTLYRKAFEVQSSNTNVLIDASLSSSNITPIKWEGLYKITEGTLKYRPFFEYFYPSGSKLHCKPEVTDTGLYLFVQGFTQDGANVIIYYIKNN